MGQCYNPCPGATSTIVNGLCVLSAADQIRLAASAATVSGLLAHLAQVDSDANTVVHTIYLSRTAVFNALIVANGWSVSAVRP